MNVRLRSKRGEEKSEPTPIRQSRFCAGYFHISREFGSLRLFCWYDFETFKSWCRHLDMPD